MKKRVSVAKRISNSVKAVRLRRTVRKHIGLKRRLDSALQRLSRHREITARDYSHFFRQYGLSHPEIDTLLENIKSAFVSPGSCRFEVNYDNPDAKKILARFGANKNALIARLCNIVWRRFAYERDASREVSRLRGQIKAQERKIARIKGKKK